MFLPRTEKALSLRWRMLNIAAMQTRTFVAFFSKTNTVALHLTVWIYISITLPFRLLTLQVQKCVPWLIISPLELQLRCLGLRIVLLLFPTIEVVLIPRSLILIPLLTIQTLQLATGDLTIIMPIMAAQYIVILCVWKIQVNTLLRGIPLLLTAARFSVRVIIMPPGAYRKRECVTLITANWY